MRDLRAASGRWFWWLIIPAFAAVAVGICLGLWRAATTPKSGIRVEQFEAELRQQLPAGSTREQVRDWFARQDH